MNEIGLNISLRNGYHDPKNAVLSDLLLHPAPYIQSAMVRTIAIFQILNVEILQWFEPKQSF